MLEEIKNRITSDKEYLTWMDKISKVEMEFAASSPFNNQVALDHGIKHMTRVASITYILLKDYGENENTCFLGYVAGLTHDIGMIYGKKNHAKNGSELVLPFLTRLNLLPIEEIKKVVEAIAMHGNGEGTNIIGKMLAIADKIDMCKERTLGTSSPIKAIKDYKVYIENNILKINYSVTSEEGKIGFYIIPKSLDIPTQVGNSLGLKVEFYLNQKLENFSDRKDYLGEIYSRNSK